MTTYAYVRISSLKQEAGFGKEVQHNAIAAFAATNELTPITWMEETESGTTFADRPVFQLIREKAAAGDSIIVFKLDRFSRHMIETEIMLGELFERQIRVHSTQPAEQGWLDPERFKDPQSVLMRRVMSAFNEYDKAVVLSRMSSGLKAKAAAGGFAGGTPPFGYMIVNDDLAIDPAKAPAALEVLRLDAEGRSLRNISEIMKREFAHIVAYSKSKDATKTMGWDIKTISRILQRRMLYTQGRYRDRNSEVDKQRDDLIIWRS
jgi:DNA invertase Pin-like site-specific DNA recombinase